MCVGQMTALVHVGRHFLPHQQSTDFYLLGSSLIYSFFFLLLGDNSKDGKHCFFFDTGIKK